MVPVWRVLSYSVGNSCHAFVRTTPWLRGQDIVGKGKNLGVRAPMIVISQIHIERIKGRPDHLDSLRTHARKEVEYLLLKIGQTNDLSMRCEKPRNAKRCYPCLGPRQQ